MTVVTRFKNSSRAPKPKQKAFEGLEEPTQYYSHGAKERERKKVSKPILGVTKISMQMTARTGQTLKKSDF